MAINRDSNVYTIVFATIMVVIVGGLLAFIASSLKPLQQANETNAKMQNILQSIGLEEMRELQRDDAGAKFNDYVKRRITINYKGEILSDKTAADAIDPLDKLDAFNINLRKEYSRFVKPIMSKHKGDAEGMKKALNESEDIHFPIFVCENNGETYYVLSASGKGLWDDVWGYIGFKSDAKTINGSVFDHKGETPGLGSIITEAWFEDQFVGKTIDEVGVYAPIEVLKPGNDLDIHQVDGLSGATFTGVGIDEMLERNLAVYYNFFKNNPSFTNGGGSTVSENTGSTNTVGTEDGTEIVESDSMSHVDAIQFTGNFSSDLDVLFHNYESGLDRGLVLQGVTFKQGGAKLKIEESKQTLEVIAERLIEEANMALRVSLSGHTHTGPNETLNVSLSKKRAENVKTYLVERGVDASRIETEGFGSSQLLSEESGKEARVKNRRTEIKIIK